MIVSRIHGGLGNQMFQYAYGLYLAEHYGTELVLDNLTYHSDRLRTYMLDRLAIQARLITTAERRLLPWRRGGRGLWNLLQGKAPLQRIRERPFGFHPKYLAPGPRVYVDGFWQSDKFFPGMCGRLQAQFQLVARLRPESVRLALRMERGHSVSVHIRRGDYVENPGTMKIHGLCSPVYYDACVAALLKHWENLHLYLFSDDHDWCRKHLRFPCPTTYVDHCGPDGACEDMWLMTRCRHHIVANSSLSWWGAWLGIDPTGSVYAPLHWFQDASLDSSSIVPEGWIKMAGQAVPRQQAA